MDVKRFIDIIGADFYVGVPDSQLKALCDYLMDVYDIDQRHHIIAANEGNCVALAAGYYFATGKIPAIYMQNSGEGNIINPLTSLLSSQVYAIPAVFMIGWRGEPGIRDEPQHAFQGQVTLKLLDDMGVRYFVVGADTEEDELCSVMAEFRRILMDGSDVAFVIRKNALSYDKGVNYANGHGMCREEVIRRIAHVSEGSVVVSSTGKMSRELYEIRSKDGHSHEQDLLTVGSMGHCSSIALGIAIHKPERKVWCIDGDGAVLMHMGALALIGACSPPNMIHIVANNSAHESVGGMPTVAGKIDLAGVAKACGYPYVVCVDGYEALDEALQIAKRCDSLTFIETICSIESRKDLGRPDLSPLENKQGFMNYLQGQAGDGSE